MDGRILVSYYSRCGNTRVVARELAERLRCDIEEIRDTKNRLGTWNWLIANIQGLAGSLTILEPLAFPPAEYDLLVVCTPVWNSSVSVPIRTYLRQQAGRMPRKVGLVVTHGGTGRGRVLRQMAALIGHAPAATLVVKAREIREGSALPKIAAFAEELLACVRAPDRKVVQQ